MGDGINLEETQKSKLKKEELFFIALIGVLEMLEDRTENISRSGLNTIDYDEPYINIIESLMYRHYGEFETLLIFWWMEEQKGNNKNITIKDAIGKEYTVNTTTQLYRALKKLKTDGGE